MPIVLAVVARILACSLLAAVLGAGLGLALFMEHSGCVTPYSDYIIPTLLLAIVGAFIGALAAAAGEIVYALQRKTAN